MHRPWNSTKIHPQSIKIGQNRSTSTKIHQNLPKSIKMRATKKTTGAEPDQGIACHAMPCHAMVTYIRRPPLGGIRLRRICAHNILVNFQSFESFRSWVFTPFATLPALISYILVSCNSHLRCSKMVVVSSQGSR